MQEENTINANCSEDEEASNKSNNIKTTAQGDGRHSIHNAVVAGMLSAVAFILMFIEVPVPMLIPSFIKLDISDLPALLGSFALGPVYGVIISFLKNLLIILIKGTGSAYVGELSNFILGAAFTFTAGVIYHKQKNYKRAVKGAVIGALIMALISVVTNYYVVYPAYEKFFGLPMNVIVGMYQAILPAADSLIKCLIIFNVPFTFIKGMIDVGICFLIYKPLSPILHGRK